MHHSFHFILSTVKVSHKSHELYLTRSLFLSHNIVHYTDYTMAIPKLEIERSECVRELFPKDHDDMTLTHHFLEEHWMEQNIQYKTELDSFIFSCETVEDLIPELSVPYFGEPLIASSPVYKQYEYSSIDEKPISPLSIEIPNQTVKPPNVTGGLVSVNYNFSDGPCPGLLRVANTSEYDNTFRR